MYRYEDITSVQLEITEKCNAQCPACPSNFYGYGKIPGLSNKNMSLDEFKFLFTPKFLQQLRYIDFCGMYGDSPLNKDFPLMLEYIYDINPNIKCYVSTNGSYYNKEYWQQFAKHSPNLEIIFAIDGVTPEVHSYYRRNTSLDKILENAKAFIDAGGKAKVQFIVFKHNQHQIEDVKELVKKYKFHDLDIKNSDRRDAMPTYSNKGDFFGFLEDGDTLYGYERGLDNIKEFHDSVTKDLYIFNKAELKIFEKENQIIQQKFYNNEDPSNFKVAEKEIDNWDRRVINYRDKELTKENTDDFTKVDLLRVLRGGEHEYYFKKNRQIDCSWLKRNAIYFTVDGYLYPCCYMGHTHTRIANQYTVELKKLLHKFNFDIDVNNALKHGVEGVFNSGFLELIENTWTPETKENNYIKEINKSYDTENGNLTMCSTFCSNCDYNA